MEKLILILGLFVLNRSTIAQIVTEDRIINKAEEVFTKKDIYTEKPYDGSENFLGENAEKYIGQILQVKEKLTAKRATGYKGFVIDKNKPLTNFINIYKGEGNYHSAYDALVGKYFKVIAVQKHPEYIVNSVTYGETYFLTLEAQESGEIVYYIYESDKLHDFPFIVSKFFQTQINNVLGQHYVFTNVVMEDAINIETRKKIEHTPGQVWECIDLQLVEHTKEDVSSFYALALMLMNPLGEKAYILYESFLGKKTFMQTISPKAEIKGWSETLRAYSQAEAKTYETRFGQRNWLRILDGTIAEGFTKEMVLLAWGNPVRIEEVSYGTKWTFFSEKTLFFEGEILMTLY